MIAFMRRYGFWGVFIMSAWPNALFDLCGICCGASKMPFWDFFGALFLGKACTKVPPQVFIMILLFSEVYRDTYVSIFTTFLRNTTPDSWGLVAKVEEGVAKVLASNSGQATGDESKGWVGTIFAGVITMLIVTFALSCVEEFARSQQREYDMKELGPLKEKAALEKAAAEVSDTTKKDL